MTTKEKAFIAKMMKGSAKQKAFARNMMKKVKGSKKKK